MNRLLLIFFSMCVIAQAEQLGQPAAQLAWSADGKLVAASDWKEVAVWEMPSGKKRLTLAAPQTTSLAFSPDGQKLALSRVGESLLMYDTQKGNLLWKSGSGRKPEDAKYTGLAVFFLPSGVLVTAGTGQGRSQPDPYLRWFNVPDGKQVRKLQGAPYASWDFKHWAVVRPGQVDLVDIATGHVQRTLKLEDGWSAVGFLEPGQKFILEKQGEIEGPKIGPGTLRLVDNASGQETKIEKCPPTIGSAPDGRLILAYGDGLFDRATQKTVKTGGWPQDFNGQMVVVTDLRTCQVTDSQTGKTLLKLPPDCGEARFSRDGARLAARTGSGVTVYDSRSWKPVLLLK